MKMIQLTSGNDWDQKFWLNTELIEALVPTRGNRCEIRLTTGRYWVALESAETIRRMIKELSKTEEE